MSVLGIITEYNPFHNGHLYHLNESKKITGADFTICVMSGNYIQRGEPAIADKWTRAEMAVKGGVDLVIELPSIYACSSAEHFAFGSVSILNRLGIVDYLCFGSESGNIADLEKTAAILSEESYEFKTAIKIYLDKGMSFPKARELALKDVAHSHAKNISTSNNILGIEYLKAIKKLDSAIKPFTIKRIANEYNCETLTGEISSATAIRKALCEYLSNQETGCLSHISNAMPDFSFNILLNKIKTHFIDIKNYETIVLSCIRMKTAEELREINEITEGLENRIKKAAESCTSYDEFIEYLKTKRYTKTRLQRIIVNILAGLTKQNFELFNNYGGPQYARILAFNDKGRFLLSKIKERSSIPVIIKPSDIYNKKNHILYQNEFVKKMFDIENRLTNIYSLLLADKFLRAGNIEFKNKPFYYINA